MPKISLGSVFGPFGSNWSLEEIAMEEEFDEFAYEFFLWWEQSMPLEDIVPQDVAEEVMAEIEIPPDFDRQEVHAHVLKRIRMWCNLPSERVLN